MQIIDRLPMTVESLKSSKLGKIVVKVGKDIPSPGESSFHIFPVNVTLQNVPGLLLLRA